jgi:hypothetical protein
MSASACISTSSTNQTEITDYQTLISYKNSGFFNITGVTSISFQPPSVPKISSYVTIPTSTTSPYVTNNCSCTSVINTPYVITVNTPGISFTTTSSKSFDNKTISEGTTSATTYIFTGPSIGKFSTSSQNTFSVNFLKFLNNISQLPNCPVTIFYNPNTGYPIQTCSGQSCATSPYSTTSTNYIVNYTLEASCTSNNNIATVDTPFLANQTGVNGNACSLIGY